MMTFLSQEIMTTHLFRGGRRVRTAVVASDDENCPHFVIVPIENAIPFRIAMVERGLRVVQTLSAPPHYGLQDTVTFCFQDRTDKDNIRAAWQEWRSKTGGNFSAQLPDVK